MGTRTCAVGGNALVEFEEDVKVSKGGILLPDSAARDVRWGKLLSIGLEMGNAASDPPVTYEPDFGMDGFSVGGWSFGDRVLVRSSGLPLPELGERVEVIRSEQILAVQPVENDG